MFRVVIANAEKMHFSICERQAFVFHKNPAIRIPAADSLASCDNQASKQGLSVQAADGWRRPAPALAAERLLRAGCGARHFSDIREVHPIIS